MQTYQQDISLSIFNLIGNAETMYILKKKKISVTNKSHFVFFVANTELVSQACKSSWQIIGCPNPKHHSSYGKPSTAQVG